MIRGSSSSSSSSSSGNSHRRGDNTRHAYQHVVGPVHAPVGAFRGCCMGEGTWMAADRGNRRREDMCVKLALCEGSSAHDPVQP
jgi:hypothetical protein